MGFVGYANSGKAFLSGGTLIGKNLQYINVMRLSR